MDGWRKRKRESGSGGLAFLSSLELRLHAFTELKLSSSPRIGDSLEDFIAFKKISSFGISFVSCLGTVLKSTSVRV